MEDLELTVTEGVRAGEFPTASLDSLADILEPEWKLSWCMETLRWMLEFVSSLLFLSLLATPAGFLTRSSCSEDLLSLSLLRLMSMLPRSTTPPPPPPAGAGGGGGRLSLAGSLSWRAWWLTP